MPKAATSKSQIPQIIKNIEKYDTEHLESMLDHYSRIHEVNEPAPDNSAYKQQLLTKIIEGYYTFQQSAKNKPLALIKSPIYHQLFKYLHKQIHFNSFLKAYLQLTDEDLNSLRLGSNQLREQLSNIQVENNQLREQLSKIKTEITKTRQATGTQNQAIQNIYTKFNAEIEPYLRKSEVTNQQVTHLTQDFQTLDHRQNAIYELIKRSSFGTSQHQSPGSKVFYSQFGEDTWIVNNLDLPKRGTFVDVGAADGITYSNTYYFEKQGWEGVCFEPNPENLAIASKLRQNVEPIAITLHDGTAEFYIDPNSPDWSGLDQSTPAYTNSISVKTKTLTRALMDANIKQVDLLSVDTEGTELDVLKSLDFSVVKPTIMIIEFLSRTNADKRSTILKQINSITNRGYSLVHTTKANLILVSK